MNVLITGTSSGIGTACAKKFIDEGHHVIGIDKIEISNKLFGYSENYKHLTRDIRHINVLDDISENIDILINNAGVQNEDDIEVNLVSTIRFTELFLKKNTPKSIVMVASTSAHDGAEFPEYAASKGGLLAYTKNVAKRLAPSGTCNSISPGGVITALNLPVLENIELWQKIMEDTPMKKWATAEEIAEWIYFMSVINKSMTGQDIFIDNGEAINKTFYW